MTPRTDTEISPSLGLPAFLLKTGIVTLSVLFAIVIVSRLIYPFDVGHLEAFSWVPAGHILDGQNPYAFATVPPYSMVPYGYAYYGLLALGIKITGLNLWWGRALSAIAFLGCIWVVCKITRSFAAESRFAALFAVLAGLALLPAQAWTAVMRPDLIAMFFGLGAVYFAFVESKRFNSIELPAVVVLCVAAFFTKHTFSLPIIVIFLRYLQLRRYRTAAAFAVVTVICIAGGMYLLNRTSNGGYVWQHFTHAQTLPWTAEHMGESVLGFSAAPSTLVFVGLVVVAVIGSFARASDRSLNSLMRSPRALIVLYLLLSAATTAVASGRVGANINYYLEVSFIAAVVCGIMIEKLEKIGRLKLISAFAVLMIGSGVFQLLRAVRGEYFRWESYPYYQEIENAVKKEVQPGDLCFSVYAELVVRSGCVLYFDDYGEYTADWTPELHSIFENEVNEGKFAAIIWSSDDFDLIYPNYRKLEMVSPPPRRFWKVFLFVRRSEPAVHQQ